ncbi:hypothetical protein COCVIDRAFT_12943 [Bipolaris victoriae FI3]|uniref:Uncharacterized protein n=1 Tax=Bipolaris victoriae (strain FI3) TaxID=930091 RepID=W7F3P6_BIPV3|nr:hypothetical protein COCVIDRAFT_12943 [Bipolaris victoriae FI3]
MAPGPKRRPWVALQHYIYQSIHGHAEHQLGKKTGVALAGQGLALHSAPTGLASYCAGPPPIHPATACKYTIYPTLSLPFPHPPLPLLLATWLGLSAIAARDSRARYTRPPWHTPLHIHLGPRHTASALSSALALAM